MQGSRWLMIGMLVALSAGLAGCDSPGGLRVKIFKPDGARQCEGQGVSVNEMRGELLAASIPVFCAQKAHDGQMRAACCGCASDTINVYSIQQADLARAEKLGFAPVSRLPDYRDKPCDI